jgi:hypothetical protein
MNLISVPAHMQTALISLLRPITLWGAQDCDHPIFPSARLDMASLPASRSEVCAQSIEPLGTSPEEFSRLVENNAKLVKEAGLTMQCRESRELATGLG